MRCHHVEDEGGARGRADRDGGKLVGAELHVKTKMMDVVCVLKGKETAEAGARKRVGGEQPGDGAGAEASIA